MYLNRELFGRIFIFKSYKLDKNVIGIRSDTSDGKHIFLCDVDNVNFVWLLGRVEKLIKTFKISDVHIVITGVKRYGLINTEKFTKGEIIDMQSFLDDELTRTYQQYGIKRNYWVQRTSDKKDRPSPNYFITVKSRYKNRIHSLAHMKFFNGIYKTPIKHNNDGLDMFRTDTYPTLVK